MHKRCFYLPVIEPYEYIDITGTDAFHIIYVLRMKKGSDLELFDKLGAKYKGKIVFLEKERVRIEIIKKKNMYNIKPSVYITLAQSVLKDKKMNLLIRQLTEIGVNKLVIFSSVNSIPKFDNDRIKLKLKKWEKNATEAVKQCGSSLFPEIVYFDNLDKVLELSDFNDINLLFWEKEKYYCLNQVWHNSYFKKNNRVKKLLIVMGPEGGFNFQEVKDAKKNGFLSISLGSRILRSETASLVACGIIQYLFGDIGKKT